MIDEAELADKVVVQLLANADVLQAVEDLASGGEVNEGFGARHGPDEPAGGLAHVEQDGLKGAAVGPGAERLAEAFGIATIAAVVVGRAEAHGAGRHAVGELKQDVAAVKTVKRFQAALDHMLADLIGPKGGAINAKDFGRHVGAKAKGAVLGAAVAVAEVGVFLYVPEAEVAEVDRLMRKQRSRHVNGALRRKHAEVGFEQSALVAGGEDVGEGVFGRGDFRAETQNDARDHNDL